MPLWPSWRRSRDHSLAARREPRRILLLRLERIGDLVMALEAIRDVRALAPAAQIDLVVGSWNAALAASRARRYPCRDARRASGWHATARVWECPPCCEPPGAGGPGATISPSTSSRTCGAISSRRRRAQPEPPAGASGGGGPVLDVALDYDPSAHTIDNARRLVQAAFRPHAAGVVGAAPEGPRGRDSGGRRNSPPGTWPTAGWRARERRAGDQAVAS